MPHTSKTDTRFRDRAEMLDFLLECSTVTSETLDLDQQLVNLAEMIREVVPCDLFAILLYSEKQRGLRIRYSTGHREEVVRNLVIPLTEGLTGVAGATQQPVMSGDVRSDPRYLSVVDAVRSELAVPMTARGKLVGVIDLQSTMPNAYTEQDVGMLRLVASRVAASIDNARLHRHVERHNRTLRTLAELSREFASILDLDELLKTIAGTVRKLINYDAFSILLLDAERGLLRNRFSVRYDERVLEFDEIPLSKGITGAAALAKQAIRVEDAQADPRYIEWTPGIRSEVAVPLLVPDHVVGVMDLESRRPGYFTFDHMRTLEMLAPQIAASIENARLYEELAKHKERMEKDLEAARDVQSILLPRRAPEIAGLEVAVRLRPAREISGDVYDFFDYGDEAAVVAFGDVSGKSAAAALYGALVSGLLRSQAPRRRSPALLLQSLNEALLERRVEARYATLLLMLWQARTGTLTMANAGASPPMICRGGQILEPRVEGVPLGLLDGITYEEVTFQTQPGDVLALFSDGITDQHNPREENYGTERIARALRNHFREQVEAIAETLLADLDRFADGRAIFDDQTLMLVKVRA